MESFFIHFRRIFQRNHSHNGRDDFRCRRKGFRRHVKELGHAVLVLKHHGESAVGFAPRRGCHSIDDFFLKHEMLIDYTVGDFRKLKQQRRRNVVGQISDNTKFFSFGKRSPVKLQRVGFYDRQRA